MVFLQPPNREQLPERPEFRGLSWARQRLDIRTQGELAALCARAGRPVSRPTIVRMEGDFPGSPRPYKASPASVIAVRTALEQRRVERFGAAHRFAGYPRVHCCVIARGWEDHFYREEDLWHEYTGEMRWQEEEGRRLRVEREAQGLTRRQVAQATKPFGGWWVIDHKTVAAVESGGEVAHDSRDSVKRALGLRGEHEVYPAVDFDCDELIGLDSATPAAEPDDAAA